MLDGPYDTAKFVMSARSSWLGTTSPVGSCCDVLVGDGLVVGLAAVTAAGANAFAPLGRCGHWRADSFDSLDAADGDSSAPFAFGPAGPTRTAADTRATDRVLSTRFMASLPAGNGTSASSLAMDASLSRGRAR